jgi:hypothetical protein
MNDRMVLLGKRDKSKCLGGLWEYPGGKVEPNRDIALTILYYFDHLKQCLNCLFHNIQVKGDQVRHCCLEKA